VGTVSLSPLDVVFKPLSESACPGGELIEPCCALVMPQRVTRFLVGQVAVACRDVLCVLVLWRGVSCWWFPGWKNQGLCSWTISR
jgi:hypothetical protein